MENWTIVKWAEAVQIAGLMGVPETDLPAAGTTPQAWFADIRGAGRLENATAIIGHALPRFEAVVWAAHTLDTLSRSAPLRIRDRQALDHALRWVGEPNDGRRRACQQAAEAAGGSSAEAMLGHAVFFSGGSISMPELEPVQPHPGLAGRLASSAVIIAAHRSGQAAAVFTAALDTGEQIAARGLGALPPI